MSTTGASAPAATVACSVAAVATAALVAGAIELALPALDAPARRALQIFAVAIVGWAMAPLDDVYVALVAAIAMALFVTGAPDRLFAALGHNLVWLLVAAFVLAEAFRVSGLADHLARRALGGARTPRRLFHVLTAVMLASAFVLPSTAGRAAILLPVFLTVAGALPAPGMRIALALLFPTGILIGAFGSLVGAGAHIAALELLTAMTGRTLSFAAWAVLALPLAALGAVLATEIILRMFLSRDDRRMTIGPIAAVARAPRPLALWRHPVLLVVGAVLAGWMTRPLHGVDETLVVLAGALVVTLPRFGVVRFADALKAVDWSLLVFLAATFSLAQALIAADVAGQLLGGPLAALRGAGSAPLAIAAAVATVGILLHLVVHSRTARVAVLVPPVLLLAVESGLDPLALMLIAVAATGFCQTLMVSAKPVLMFGRADGPTYRQRDLLRLALVLAPLHLVLILAFAALVWPWFGVGLVGPADAGRGG